MPERYRAGKIAITYADREVLYQRINDRVDAMFQSGLLEEAQAVFASGCGPTAVQAIGYKELLPYFAGTVSLEEAKENIKRETRRYAKRQLTWLRRESGLHWIEADRCGSFEHLLAEAERILQEEEIL